MMLYKNMKAMVYSPDGDTDFFDIVTTKTRRFTSAVHVYDLARRRTSNVDRYNERK